MSSPYDPDVVVAWLDGELIAVATIPDRDLRAAYGLGHHSSHTAGRKIHLGNFPFTVDMCRADERRHEWRGTVLVCTGCGLEVG